MSNLPVALQLYTVRDILKNDFEGTTKELAKMGYKAFEFAGLYGDKKPADLAKYLKSINVGTAGQHVSLEAVGKPESDAYAYAAALGCPYLTTSLAGQVEKNWKPMIAEVSKAAAVAKANGLQFTYHNHAQEFLKVDGECALDMMFRMTDAKAVQFEVDTYWVKKGGSDPVAYLTKYAGRLPQVHLKDMDPTDGTFTEVGNGTMDLPAIFAAGAKSGARWVIVEQDLSKRPSPMDSARISIENLRKAKLA